MKNKDEIIDDIQDIQETVSNMGFMGSNEIALWERDMIADYIVGLGEQPIYDLKQPKEGFIENIKPTVENTTDFLTSLREASKRITQAASRKTYTAIVDGVIEPNNCKWSTQKEQQNNKG